MQSFLIWFHVIEFVFILGLGFFVFLNNRSKLNLVFFLVCLSISIWIFGTLQILLNVGNVEKIVFWDRFVYAGIIFFPVLVYHFSLIFVKKYTKLKLYISYIIAFIFLILSRTDKFASDIYIYDWGGHLQAKFFHHIFLLFFFFLVTLVYYNIFKYYKSIGNYLERNQARYMLVSFAFLTIGGLGFSPAYGYNLVPITNISVLVFIITIAYAISKYRLMDIKVVAAEVLTLAIWLFLFLEIFTADSWWETKKLTVLVLLLTIFFGILLIRSVKKEIHQKEELGKLTRKLTRANKELKRLDTAKTEFISIASHQLKTPLTITKGFISLLTEGSYGEVREEVKEVLKKVYTSNENLILLVEDLLNISRIESGRMQYDFADWKLEEIVKGIQDILDEKARVNNLYLKINYPKGKLPLIYMDGGKVREVITNFTENALKYTKEGGVTVDFKKTDGNVQIIVTDTGIGIPKTELPFLFQKFSRGKDTKQLNATGTGLGLFVGKKIIEAHGGTVWAESQGAGKGSKFVIELPLVPPEKRKKEK